MIHPVLAAILTVLAVFATLVALIWIGLSTIS